MFKTKRIVPKAKSAGKNNKKVNNTILFKTQTYYYRKKKDLIHRKLLNPKFCTFKIFHLEDHVITNPTIKGRWRFKEHIQFLEGLDKYGVNWKKIYQLIKTSSICQIRSHSQKFFLKLKKVKDEQLGLDFTSDTINNIKDMIKSIKSINKDFDLVKVFLYLSEKYAANKEDEKQKKNEIVLNEKNDKNSNSDVNNTYTSNLNNNIDDNNDNNILVSNLNQEMNFYSKLNNNKSEDNKSFNNNLISKNNFENNIFNVNYFNNVFFTNNNNISYSNNIFFSYSNNFMIQNELLNNLTSFNSSIKNSNDITNNFNFVEKNL